MPHRQWINLKNKVQTIQNISSRATAIFWNSTQKGRNCLNCRDNHWGGGATKVYYRGRGGRKNGLLFLSLQELRTFSSTFRSRQFCLLSALPATERIQISPSPAWIRRRDWRTGRDSDRQGRSWSPEERGIVVMGIEVSMLRVHGSQH